MNGADEGRRVVQERENTNYRFLQLIYKKMLENDVEYIRAVAVDDLAKARGLENMDRLIARDPVYAAMVYV